MVGETAVKLATDLEPDETQFALNRIREKAIPRQ